MGATHMLRASAFFFTVVVAATGVARAQQYGDQAHPSVVQYPQATSSYPQGPRSDAYDEDEAPPVRAPQENGVGGYETPPDLARELRLRPDQQAAYQAYRTATNPTAAEQQQMEADVRRFAGMTTPARLDFAAAQMRRDQADFARRADAVRRFYAQLSPEQQRSFDQLTGPEGATPDEAGGYGDASGRSPR